MRLLWLAPLLSACAVVPKAQPAHDAPDAHAAPDTHGEHAHNQRAPLPAGATLANACRQGAYLEASSIINSLVEIYRALPQVPATVTMELDSALYIALKQAISEAHCVAGGLRHGYQHAFADILERGAAVAEMRGFSADIVGPARATAERLRAAQRQGEGAPE